jgi:RNA polymerase sigma-70 factor (ECF subfamily)
MDDDDLVAAVAAGDDGALRELFARHAPWLAVRLRGVLPSADVEDVLQETFLAVWRSAPRYRPARAAGGVTGVAAGGWIWGIARRQAALLLRRRGPAEQPLPALVAADDQEGIDPAEAAVSRAELGRAVDALGPDGSAAREIWRLVYVEDRPVAEVAKLIGVPEGTVKSRAFQVRRRLREALRRGALTREGEGL